MILQESVRDKLEPVVFSLNMSLHEQKPKSRRSLQNLDSFPILSQGRKLSKRREVWSGVNITFIHNYTQWSLWVCDSHIICSCSCRFTFRRSVVTTTNVAVTWRWQPSLLTMRKSLTPGEILNNESISDW